jgi:hypothetical protein
MYEKYKVLSIVDWNNLFLYEPDCGNMYYRYFNGAEFIKGTLITSVHDGYITAKTRGSYFRAHIIAVILMTGKYPDESFEVDHVNRDRKDNRWSNLRLATRTQNQANKSLQKNNTHGSKNVSFDKGYWRVLVTCKGKRYDGGRFSNKEDAINKATELRNKVFGEFACHA